MVDFSALVHRIASHESIFSHLLRRRRDIFVGHGRAGGGDPLAELAAVSSFKKVELDALAAGTVLIARGPAMNLARGLAVESVYVVRKPAARTAELHVQWNPNKHPELKVFLHGELSTHPTAAEFQKVASEAPATASAEGLCLGNGSSARDRRSCN